jgi:hypothetical protein
MPTPVRGSAAWMKAYWGPSCQPDLTVIPIYPGGPKLQVDRRAAPAMLRMGRVFVRHCYIVHTVGCYNCRANTSNPNLPSNHSWATATDVNEATNPYRRDRLVTDMSPDMIADIENIKTVNGVKVFRWGGHFLSVKDAMHFEIIATPDELAAGFLDDLGDNAATHPVLRIGARGPAVNELQRLLKMVRTTGNGIFGPRTEIAVRLYQSSRGLVSDGIVGRIISR